MKRAASVEAIVVHDRSKKAKLAQTLESLLDVSMLATVNELEERFLEIADVMCNRSFLRLYVDQTFTQYVDYALLEIEFYLMKPGHDDPFCHAAEEQKLAGQWYFHRAPTRTPPGSGSNAPTPGFRGGTRKGLDLTFGGAGAIGGILLRSMRRLSDGTLVSGPSLLVDELLARACQPSIAALVGTWPTLSAFASSGPPVVAPLGMNGAAFLPPGPTLQLVSCDLTSARAHQIHSGPRIGLDLSHKTASASASDPRVRFVAAAYRFFVAPEALTVNGRMQTFVGLYEQLLATLGANEPRAVLKAAEMMALRAGTADEYVRYYRAGLKGGAVDKFIGVKTSSPKAYLEMVGAIRTYLAAGAVTAAATGLGTMTLPMTIQPIALQPTA